MKFIKFILGLFKRAPVVNEHEAYQRALAVLKDQRPYYNPSVCNLPQVTREYRAACRTLLHNTESALRFNREDWLENGNPHSDPIPAKEQTEEEAKALFPSASVDHHKLALSLADAW